MLRQSDAGLRAGAVGLRRGAVFLFGDRIPAVAGAFYGPRGLRLILNVATALLVLSLPFTAAAAVNATTPTGPETVALASIASVTDDGAGRAATAARGLLAGSRSVVTIAAADVRPVIDYKVEDGDNLGAIAQKYQVDLDDLAFANGIEDESRTLHIGETLQIPPGQGALYTVTDKDTVASVAKRFSVEASVIMTYNRLYFEPEHFAPGQLIFVPGAEVARTTALLRCVRVAFERDDDRVRRERDRVREWHMARAIESERRMIGDEDPTAAVGVNSAVHHKRA